MNIPISAIKPFGVLGFPKPIVNPCAELEMVMVTVDSPKLRTIKARWTIERK